jgi:hypothetical protein
MGRYGADDMAGLFALGMESWMVVGLRLAKLAGGGMPALIEAQRMILEKQSAAIEAQMEATTALALGYSHAVAGRRAMKPIARRVRANRRRLSGK